MINLTPYLNGFPLPKFNTSEFRLVRSALLNSQETLMSDIEVLLLSGNLPTDPDVKQLSDRLRQVNALLNDCYGSDHEQHQQYQVLVRRTSYSEKTYTHHHRPHRHCP